MPKIIPVPPMVFIVTERNNCCRSIFVPDACDRGHNLFCQKRQKPANCHERWWALEAPFTRLKQLMDMRNNKEGRNRGSREFTDWCYFSTNSVCWIHAITTAKRWCDLLLKKAQYVGFRLWPTEHPLFHPPLSHFILWLETQWCNMTESVEEGLLPF